MFEFINSKKSKPSLFIFPLLFNVLFGQGFLHTSNTNILDGNGDKLILKGVALGGWLVPEGYMFQIPGSGSPTTIRKKIVNLVGEDSANEFYQKFEQNYIQEEDIKAIANWGFNSVRLPLHYKFFSPSIGEYVEKGFVIIDSVVTWSKRNNLYVILDMHAAPGGQSPGEIADANGIAELWTKKQNQDHLVEIWGEIAKRYSNELTIGGYDLINEPVLPNNMGNKENRSLHVKMRNRIRQYDKNHIIFVNGNYYSTTFSGLSPAFDKNMVWSFHKYWNDVTIGTIQYLINFGIQTNRPLWLGEFGENSNEWWSRVINLVESRGIGWNWWTYKKYDTITTIASVPITDNYKAILDYWGGKSSKPSPQVSYNGLMEMAEGLLFKNCEIRRDVIASLIDKRYLSESIPFKNNIIPGMIAFADYDIGGLGISYMDYVYMRTGVGDQTSGGNTGWSYRNDGVDIEKSTDTTLISYNVGWTEPGEFLNYTIEVIKEGKYIFTIRSASETNSSSVTIFLGQEKIIDALDLPNTKGSQIWKDTILGEALLPKGKNLLSVRINRSGANLKLLNIQSKEAIGGLRIFEHKLYPNPMSDKIKIEFTSVVKTDVNISIYNINGQKVWGKTDKSFAGSNHIIWNGKNMNESFLASGIYFISLDDGHKIIKEKVTLIR